MTRNIQRGRKALAALMAAVMVVSMLGVGFAGSAAGDVQEFDEFEVDDVVAGGDGVEQTVTLTDLENDGNDETITISNNAGLDGNVITDVEADDQATDHDVQSAEFDASTNEIVVDLNADSAATDDLELTVTHDLTETQDATVEYTVSFEDGTASDRSQTFDVSVAQPSFDDGDSTIPESAPDTIEIEFDEEIEVVGTSEELDGAFTLTGVEDDSNAQLSVEDFETDSTTLTLELDDFVASDADVTEISYDGAEAGATAGSNADDPVVHANDNDVPALASTDEDPTVNAVPTLESAIIEDGSAGEVTVTFTENVDTTAEGDLHDSFESDAFDFDASSGSSEDTAEITLEIAGDDAAAGADFENDLTYVGDDNGGTAITAAAEGSNAEVVIEDGDIENNVAPRLDSAEVTNDNKDWVLVTFDGDIEAGPDDAEADINNAFTFTDAAAETDGLAGDGFDEGDSTQVALGLTEAIESADGELEVLTYTSQSSGEGADAVQSTSGTVADSSEDAEVTNDVTPTFEDAEVTNTNPDQLRVTFSESVVADADNTDVAVTEAFTFANEDIDYRVRNSAGTDNGGETVILNLGTEEGDALEVDFEDDLTESLTYDPQAPSSAGNENPFIADDGNADPAEAFENEDVNNNVDVDVEVASAETVQDQATSQTQLEVTFTNDVERAGTISELEDDFAFQDTGTIDEFVEIDGDTVVFETSDIANSGTDISDLDYRTGEANDNEALVAAADNDYVVPSFTGQTVENNLQPYITGASIEVPGDELEVTFSEDIAVDGTDAEVAEAFDYDAGTIDGESGVSQDTITLTLEEPVEEEDVSNVDSVTYTEDVADNPIESAEGSSDAVATTSSAIVANNIEDRPVLQNVTVDDANINNADDDGEMLLAFDRDISVDGTDAAGLEFEANNVDVNIEIDSLENDAEQTDAPEHVVVAEFSSVSGSDNSSIRAEDDLSAATLEVTESETVDISVADADDEIAEVTTDEVSNEIAGDLTNVDSTEIDVDLIGTEEEETGDFTVTVSGFEDATGTTVIDEQITVEIEDADTELNVNLDRFEDEVTTDPVTPDDIDTADAEIGELVNVTVANADVAEEDQVGLVHESKTTDTEGFFLESQPMPGEFAFLNGTQFGDVSYYDTSNQSDAGFEGYADADQTERVHNALFIESKEDGAEYGYIYDEDRSPDEINVGSFELEEGWHVLGSNYDIKESGQQTFIDLSEDLGTQQAPSSAGLSVQDETLPGTTLEDDYKVNNYEAYYVYIHETDDRPVVLPEYEPES